MTDTLDRTDGMTPEKMRQIRERAERPSPDALYINDAEIGTGIAADMLDGPFGAARFLFQHLAARNIPVTAGQWISTGAVTGVHQVAVGDRVEARFDGRLSIHCTITAQ